MSIRIAIRHTTRYTYERPISLSPHTVRLRPAPHTRTPIKGYSLHIEPAKHFINWQQDPFGNFMARLVFPEKVKEFLVDVEVIADMITINPFDFFVEDYAHEYPFTYPDQLQKQLAPYLELSDDSDRLDEWIDNANSLITKDMLTIDFLVALNRKLSNDISYRIRMEPGVQTCEQTLQLGSGSCRDSAWLLVQIARRFGLAARFASGYLVQLKPDQKSIEGPSGPAEDFTDLHAWTEVYLPGAGWVGLDPTSGLLAGEGHIPLACTPSPESAAPISGSAEVVKTEFFFENKVERIVEKPRVSKPYKEAEWNRICALGKQVEADLQAGDVRLTMGGEPTFVAIDQQDAPEWNTAADGAHKRKLASQLFTRLRGVFGPGGVLHYGQGKWYPGEPLPRWKMACYWRKDGKPIWNDVRLMADLGEDYQLQTDAAQQFLTALMKVLHVDARNMQAAYEDPFYFLWEEGKLPQDADPLSVDLEDPLERQTLAKLLNRGMGKEVGYIVPVQWNTFAEAWESCQWTFRRGHLFLIPGNSPLGLRLPLGNLNEEKNNLDDPFLDQVSPMAEVGELPDKISTSGDAKHPYLNSEQTIRTAICTEVRDGKLFVFLPPLVKLEHYLSLVAAIETVATDLKIPVVLEGYDPPSDHRLEKFMVTPDPGVIEVNVHPSRNWSELKETYDVLFREAAQTRLTTEKFNLDGKHTGTGGGNHVTLGGVTPGDSPLLRRPDLLQSLITYWQHHPSLSYLFSTQFIGPTSQAPRVDEGRDEMLYELEIAFQQIPDDLQEDQVPYWLVDRIFRNLLVDVTGNTHRAEFCIDKLYSPDSSSGRLGILEFRGFDMPPHYRMCMVQFLLVRALIARFWKQPYRKKLVRWGTALHDRFLLPHYCYQDLGEVISELNEFGYPFELSWFDPFFAFRFPFLGELHADHIHLQLNMAIEPWHVLGEEISNTGTARFVDSSLERIQVKVSGLTEGRYRLLCNGHTIPLQKTDVHGTYVSGIRYRAWQPPSALHPTLGVDTPLVFDLYDTWSERTVAACKYHVSHPGGRAYETFPVNSYEAESRRVNRFFDFGHTIRETEPTIVTAGQSDRFVTQIVRPESHRPDQVKINPEFPHTMDLRRYKQRR